MRTTQKVTACRAEGQDLQPHGFFTELLGGLGCWRSSFKQERTWERMVNVLFGLLACQGRSTLTNSIMYRGLQHREWSADYKIFSRSDWKVRDLFKAVLRIGMNEIHEEFPVVVAMDDTSLPKTGTKIPQARYCHDPLAPKFADMPIMWGIRMIHAALILPRYLGHRPMAISIAFEPVPAEPKPKNEELAEAEKIEFQAKKKQAKLTTRATDLIRSFRETLDTVGQRSRKLLMVVDGSFTNGIVVRNLPHDTHLVGRFRKDAKLYAPLHVKDGKRIYGERLRTPEQYRQDPEVAEHKTDLHYGGRSRSIKFKDIPGVLWKDGTKGKMMRMLIVLPIPYQVPGKRKRGYNRVGYLLTTDLETAAPLLIQAYLDRWQIEVLHRELKNGQGVGQVQAWNKASVDKVYGAHVAAYSMLCIASHRAFGGARTADFPDLPAWRRRAPMRPSEHELTTLLRNELFRVGYFDSTKRRTKLPEGWVLLVRETYQAT